MKKQHVIFNPIGIIHTPFKTIEDMPIQPVAAGGVHGTVEIYPEYGEGLLDLDGFSHLILLYHLHKVKGFKLKVIPFMDTVHHGVFATRSPKRPNALGLSTVKLLRIEQNVLYIEMVDMLDGTPLLDIKPFFSKFDNRIDVKSGWLDKQENLKIEKYSSDKRFKN